MHIDNLYVETEPYLYEKILPKRVWKKLNWEDSGKRWAQIVSLTPDIDGGGPIVYLDFMGICFIGYYAELARSRRPDLDDYLTDLDLLHFGHDLKPEDFIWGIALP